MTVQTKGKKILSLVLSLFFLIPYTETAKIRSVLTYYYLEECIFIPAVVNTMLIIMIALLPLLFICFDDQDTSNTKFYFADVLLIRMIFDFLTLVRIIFTNKPFNILFQYIWCSVPFYFSFFIIYIINRLNLDISVIHVNVIYLFTLYLIVNIFVNIREYGYSFGRIEWGAHTRLISPGGGPVILGYTIAIMFSLLLFHKQKIKKRSFVFMFIIMIVSSFFTGSRGAMWPIVFLVTIYLINKRKLGVVLAVIVVSILYVSPIDFLKEKVPRFFILTDQSRLNTSLNVFNIFSKQSFPELLFGKGLGTFFPYQKWLLTRTPGINYFNHDGRILLVQPHNSYIYLLIETGIVGLILFFYPLYKSIRLLSKIRNAENKKYAIFTIILIALLNCFDAVFIIAPGSAALWWLILLSLTEYLYVKSTG